MKQYNGEKAIISLTSWKARINTVSKTLFSLIKQCPGFHIVLVLSEEEFPQKEQELPKDLMLFIDNNLIELLWVYKNYKSFKKVLFTMNKYKNIPVISADDDCIYTCNYAEKLYSSWINHKNCIITNNGGHNRYLNWCRGPNTLYPNNIIINPFKLCDSYFSQNFKFIEEDVLFGIIAKKYDIKIIDLKQKSFYYFHDEIEPENKHYKWNFYNIFKQLNNFIMLNKII